MRRKRQHDLPIDGDTETVAGEVFTFDEKAARRACDFFPTYLVHTKGPRALVGKPVTLAPWEHRLIWPVFGWGRAGGTPPLPLGLRWHRAQERQEHSGGWPGAASPVR